MLNGYSENMGLLMTDTAVLNRGTDDELSCYGYCDNTGKKILFYFLVVVTFGLVLLLLYWKPELECYIKKSRCALYKADTVLLLQDSFDQKFVSAVKDLDVSEGIPDGSDAYNREVSTPENTSDFDDIANLTVKQDDSRITYFDHQHLRYIWNDKQKSYAKLLDLSSNTKCSSLHERHGLTASEQAQKRIVHGVNSIEVEVKSYWKLFIEEVLNPFYIFQIGSIILWCIENYYIYASAILLISIVSICISLYETKRQMTTLHDMVQTEAQSITVSCGDGNYRDVSVIDLVPGDVIVIPAKGCTMTCDAVLMAGTCIVNESMLTGESVPVTKTPLAQQEDDEMFSAETHKRHTLFAGTKVVQTRYYGHAKVSAVVVRTGFSTAKGELVRGILFPKPLGFKFYQDAMRFIMFLGVFAMFGMAYSLYQYVKFEASTMTIIVRVLDVITIVVPPALPAAMTVGTVYAQNRLKKKQIFCISPPRINFCGRINLFCFDKTGTLTEDGLDMWGAIPVVDRSFSHVARDPDMMDQGHFLIGMASCHSLTIIDGEISGDPLDIIMFNSTKWSIDEPGADTSKFDNIMPTVVRPATRASFMPDADLADIKFEIGIVRQFTFSSSLQRMSVITRSLTEHHMDVYCKGAPEKIASLCDPDTVPSDFHDILHQYTIQGFRVIALAWKALDPKITWHNAQRIARDKVESDLTFVGLIVMQNKLKRQTKPVIKTLSAADVRSVMVTGDMIKTAISVARNCGMVNSRDKVVIVNAQGPDASGAARIEWELAEAAISTSPEFSDYESEETPFLTSSYQHKSGETYNGIWYQAAKQVTAQVIMDEPPRTHLAVSGKSFAVINSHFPELLPKICVQGTIFARMLPDQKCQLIEKLQGIGYTVGMCGDGANDCEALKAAHAGISLSEAEASVAAPFTSRNNNIECVVTVMREGRAALVTSFGCFKYMALYSFIQFISIMIVYTYGVNLGDMQYLYIDLCITATIAVLMGYTSAYQKLVARRPDGSLVKSSNLLSICVQVFLTGLFQVAALLYLKSQPWYTPVDPSLTEKDHGGTICWEGTVIFIFSSFQYISIAFCFSKGPPFRKPIYTNIPFVISLVVLAAMSASFLLFPWKPILDFFRLEQLNNKAFLFRGLLLTMVFGHLLAAMLAEYLITENETTKALLKSVKQCCRKKADKNVYKRLEQEVACSDWPPIGQVTYALTNHIMDDTHVTVENIPLGLAVN